MMGLRFKMKKSNTSGSWVTTEEKEHTSESNGGKPDFKIYSKIHLIFINSARQHVFRNINQMRAWNVNFIICFRFQNIWESIAV